MYIYTFGHVLVSIFKQLVITTKSDLSLSHIKAKKKKPLSFGLDIRGSVLVTKIPDRYKLPHLIVKAIPSNYSP